MRKVGIIRCRQTEDMCTGTTDFKVAKEGRKAFEETGPVEIVSCGGCPGKRAVARAKLMVDRGADTNVLASCISRGNPGLSLFAFCRNGGGNQEKSARK